MRQSPFPFLRAIFSLVWITVPILAWAENTNAPLNYFTQAYGPVARQTMVLGWVFSAITVSVCIIIALLLLAAIFHKRPEERAHAIGQESRGLRWITIGTAISTCVLLGMAIYMLVALNQASEHPAKPALTIVVTSYDWWWKAEYHANTPEKYYETANEIHIPVGVPVRLRLKSADVIHTFWVPALAGKTEMIPGMTNEQWIEADRAGVYRGQCTQFCGVQHAHMAFEVVALPPDDFSLWEQRQQRPAPAPTGLPLEGQHIFMHRCAACHTVCGSTATGEHGPDLTHLGSRRLLAAGMFANTPERLMDWVQHAQQLKPGSRMPDIPLSPEDANALSSYLMTLK